MKKSKLCKPKQSRRQKAKEAAEILAGPKVHFYKNVKITIDGQEVKAASVWLGPPLRSEDESEKTDPSKTPQRP